MTDINAIVAKMFDDSAPVFKAMAEFNAGVLKVTPEIKGKKLFAIIFVVGDTEVSEITAAVQAVEDKWEAE